MRLRWYGDFREDADVFVEKKTHYGPGRRSVKERRRCSTLLPLALSSTVKGRATRLKLRD